MLLQGPIEEVASFVAHPEITDLSWSPDGVHLATVQHDVGLHIYITPSGKETLRYPGSAASVAWSPDGHRIAFGSGASGDISVTVIESVGGARVWTDWLDFDANRRIGVGRRPQVLVSWSPDGRYIAATKREDGRNSSELRVIDALTGAMRWEESAWNLFFRGPPSCTEGLVAVPANRNTGGSTYDGEIPYFIALTGGVIRKIRAGIEVSRIVWSPSGSRLAASVRGGPGTPDSIRLFGLNGSNISEAHGFDGCLALSWSHDERLIACAGIFPHFSVLDVATGAEVFKYPSAVPKAMVLKWAPHHPLLAVCDFRTTPSGVVRIFRARLFQN
jgi:WD40 repeat protein